MEEGAEGVNFYQSLDIVGGGVGVVCRIQMIYFL